jgi:hypothetical protein
VAGHCHHAIAPPRRPRYTLPVSSPPPHFLPTLFDGPGWYPFAFEAEALVMLPMDRAAYARSIFLDDRIIPAAETPVALPLAALPTPPSPRPAGWIFHVAHCGSTLLARALDRPAGGLVLREPLALRQLGFDAAAGTADWPEKLAIVRALLSRRAQKSASPTIIKANVPANFGPAGAISADPAERAIFLYFPLESYLLAILRSPNHRAWVRAITDSLAPAIVAAIGAPLPDADAQRAAALWLAQMRLFNAALAAAPHSRSLDAEALFTAPAPVLAAAATLFGQPIPAAEIDSIVNGPLFATYAKNPAFAFDNAARVARRNEAATALAPELAAARQWVAPRLAENPLPRRLPQPLVPGLMPRDLLG